MQRRFTYSIAGSMANARAAIDDSNRLLRGILAVCKYDELILREARERIASSKEMLRARAADMY